MASTTRTATSVALLAAVGALMCAVAPLPQAHAKAAEDPLVCVVIRTYWGHGDSHGGSLRQLLESLKQQEHARWEALLVLLDNRAFPELHYMLKEMEDDRIWVHAEWVASEYAPKNHLNQWAPQYHTQLYEVTDEAIRACPADTKYVLVTNGDNLYSKSLFAEIAKIDADFIALDYYSRYQRPTGPPCARFEAGDGNPNCKRNERVWCKTDLGANIFNWKKFMEEDRRFGAMDTSNGAIGQDGLMAQTLDGAGWKVHSISGSCLYDHSPSPQRCAREGGVWDDTWAGSHEKCAGTCITKAEAATLLEDPDYEELTITVSQGDESFDDWIGPRDDNPSELSCIRMKGDTESLMAFFGYHCADEIDRPAFNLIKPRTLEQQGFKSRTATAPEERKPPTGSKKGPRYRKKYRKPAPPPEEDKPKISLEDLGVKKDKGRKDEL